MIATIHEDKTISVQAANYSLTVAADRPFVTLADAAGVKIADLFYPSSVHSTRGQDDTTRLGRWQIDELADAVSLSIKAESSVWTSKTFRFVCEESRLRYEIEVEGSGGITEAVYFGGHYSGAIRWGSGFFWSGQRFKQCFNPEPTHDEIYTFSPREGSVIDLCGVPLPGRGDWFYTPPPFCFAAEVESGWIGLGLEAPDGQHGYTAFAFRGQGQSGFCLAADFNGQTVVRDRDRKTYTLPAIGIDFADDPYAVLRRHSDAFAARCHPRPQATPKPGWWFEPIFCGWGSQCHLAALDKGHAPDYARQEHYEAFMRTLDAHRIDPGIVVLDDKWQAHYGTNAVDTGRWPDLRGFIDGQHARGRHVLLWLKAWDPDGVPVEECITNAAGVPLAVDPTHPRYAQRLRESVRHMLSPDGYDADGFKIDFTARIPAAPGARVAGRIWGLELMRRYLWIIHDEAKQVKPDALVMTHTPHPYLADVTDMIRLNDVNTGQDVIRTMTHRAQVARAALPDCVIDTDNWPMTNRESWRAYVQHQPDLGVPSLYVVSHIDTTGEPLEESDYALIRDSWARFKHKRDAGTLF